MLLSWCQVEAPITAFWNEHIFLDICSATFYVNVFWSIMISGKKSIPLWMHGKDNFFHVSFFDKYPHN